MKALEILISLAAQGSRSFQIFKCQSLTGIPELPPSVRDIDAHNCTALLPGSSSVNTLQGLQFLFYNCSKPYCFPGTGIPEWIWHQNVGSSIKIQLPTDWHSDDFLGFALCSVLEHLPERIICHLNSDVFNYGDLKDFGHDFHWTGNIVGHRFNSSASNVVKKCGLREAVTEQDSIEVEWTLVLVAAVMDPPMIPRSSSSANVLKNDYHHPANSSNHVYILYLRLTFRGQNQNSMEGDHFLAFCRATPLQMQRFQELGI
ncbi:hypothetical protein CK203_090392 [Vitis vinifera]|uniref:C-JID domain-containing protein n=1 Tax=Vitis vinifera TaxID=29760 RepID=A0A438C833_VITVI|nr:hypothetical protein CK203_090392 [Vitis vinifera]